MYEYLWIDCVQLIHKHTEIRTKLMHAPPCALNFRNMVRQHIRNGVVMKLCTHEVSEKKKWDKFWDCIVVVVFHLLMNFIPHEKKKKCFDLMNRELWILNMNWRVRSVLAFSHIKHTSRMKLPFSQCSIIWCSISQDSFSRVPRIGNEFGNTAKNLVYVTVDEHMKSRRSARA